MTSRLSRTVVVAAVVLLAGCSSPAPTATPEATPPALSDDASVLAALGLDGLTGREIVEQLDTSPEARPLAFAASVREDEVLVGDGTTQVAVPLEDGEFYLSVAPYVDRTHECFFHSLASCQGELVDEPVEVTITDADGVVLVEEEATTYANGFVGYWLPEDVEGTIEITRGDLSGSVPFSTTGGSPTCVTTLQLT